MGRAGGDNYEMGEKREENIWLQNEVSFRIKETTESGPEKKKKKNQGTFL